MKNKRYFILFALLLIGGLWIKQAKHNEKLVRIPLPFFGDKDTSYDFVIGKSQIYPYGTLWKRTSGPGFLSNFPVYYKNPFKSKIPVLNSSEIQEEIRRLKNNYYPTDWVKTGEGDQKLYSRELGPYTVQHYGGLDPDEDADQALLTREEMYDRLIELIGMTKYP